MNEADAMMVRISARLMQTQVQLDQAMQRIASLEKELEELKETKKETKK